MAADLKLTGPHTRISRNCQQDRWSLPAGANAPGNLADWHGKQGPMPPGNRASRPCGGRSDRIRVHAKE